MKFDAWDGALADMGVELEEASEILGISMREIESWRGKARFPRMPLIFQRRAFSTRKTRSPMQRMNLNQNKGSLISRG